MRACFRDQTMKAMAIYAPGPIESNPLFAIELPVPEPQEREILVRIRACGVCRTDLHVAEGDLPPRLPRIVPGHEIVGTVERCGRTVQLRCRRDGRRCGRLTEFAAHQVETSQI